MEAPLPETRNRQGGTLCPLLFDTALDGPARAIRQEIDGIQEETKPPLFADDMILYRETCEESTKITGTDK